MRWILEGEASRPLPTFDAFCSGDIAARWHDRAGPLGLESNWGLVVGQAPVRKRQNPLCTPLSVPPSIGTREVTLSPKGGFSEG